MNGEMSSMKGVMNLTTKEYLSQVRMLDIKINNKIKEMEHLTELSTSLGGFSFDERVQTSKETGDTIGMAVSKIVDLQKEIDEEVDNFKKIRKEIISDIEKIKNVNHYILLCKRYILFETWEQIAVEMNYSIRKIYYLHGEALKSFENIKSLQ